MHSIRPKTFFYFLTPTHLVRMLFFLTGLQARANMAHYTGDIFK